MAKPSAIERLQHEAEIAARGLSTAADEIEAVADNLGFLKREERTELLLIVRRLRSSSVVLMDEARAEHLTGVRLSSRLARLAVRAATAALTVAVLQGSAEGATAAVVNEVIAQVRHADDCLGNVDRAADEAEDRDTRLAGLEADETGAAELDHITRETMQDLYNVILEYDAIDTPELRQIVSEMATLLETPEGGGGAFTRLAEAQSQTMDLISYFGGMNPSQTPVLPPHHEAVLIEAHQAIANLQRYELLANRGRT